MTTHEAADILTRLADSFRDGPEIPILLSVSCHSPTAEEDGDGRHRLQVLTRAMLRFGPIKKSASGEIFWTQLQRPGLGFEMTVFANRTAVCRQVVVGEREIPALDAYLVPAAPARREPILEWHCDEGLFDPDTPVVS